MSERVTQAALARVLGVKRQAINALAARKILIFGEDGRIDIDEAKEAIKNNLHPTSKTSDAVRNDDTSQTPAPATAPAVPSLSYQTIKTMREMVELNIAETRLRETRGQLVDAASVRKLLANAGAQIGLILDRIPDRLAPRLVSGGTEQQIHAMLQAEIDQVRAELAAVKV